MTPHDEESPRPAKAEGFDRLSYPTTQHQDTGPDRPKTATAYKPGTQVDRVLRRLLHGWTCGSTFLEERLPRYSARIAELRADGWYIERRQCAHGHHRHETTQFEWRIDRKPAGNGQLFGDPL